jgi:hypothetical protein
LLDCHKIGLVAERGYKVTTTPHLGGPPPPWSYCYSRLFVYAILFGLTSESP